MSMQPIIGRKISELTDDELMFVASLLIDNSPFHQAFTIRHKVTNEIVLHLDAFEIIMVLLDRIGASLPDDQKASLVDRIEKWKHSEMSSTAGVDDDGEMHFDDGDVEDDEDDDDDDDDDENEDPEDQVEPIATED